MKLTTPVAMALVLQATPTATLRAQDALLFSANWAATGDGQLPASVKVLNGRASVATRDGAKFLRVEDSQTRNFDWAVIEVAVGRALPDDFTIEFDLIAPLSTSYPVEVRTAQRGDPLGYLGATSRASRVVAHCGAIRTGVYGSTATTSLQRQADSVAKALHRCRVAVSGHRLEVGFAGVRGVVLNDVDFGRSDRIALVIPATEGKEAYMGPVEITSRGSITEVGSAGTATAVQQPQPAPPPTVPIMQVKQVVHQVGAVLAPLMFQPFDSTPGTLTAVRVHVEGALAGQIATSPNFQSAGGAPIPVAYPVVIETRHRLTGTGAAAKIRYGGPALFQLTRTASGNGEQLPVNVPFSYTFTITQNTDLMGGFAPAVPSGSNAVVPPMSLLARTEDFLKTVMTGATGLTLDSLLETQVTAGTVTPAFTLGGTVTITYEYTPPTP
ncbi:MAG TPA: hypothetical protein VMM17_09235 [Gemmatimonadaceae bacterium]|nr:hypothetical protein [Gemmatimonadaceae bacterium]